jgi:predicted RNA binding protein YcfA (HicA-like mRNA interferase family)
VSRLRVVPYKKLAAIAKERGFQWNRRRGSHNTYQNSSGQIVVLVDHGAENLKRGLIAKIIRDLGLTVDEYNDLLDTV